MALAAHHKTVVQRVGHQIAEQRKEDGLSLLETLRSREQAVTARKIELGEEVSGHRMEDAKFSIIDNYHHHLRNDYHYHCVIITGTITISFPIILAL